MTPGDELSSKRPVVVAVNIDEQALTLEDKVSLLWKSIMGYGYGTERIPGLLEQARDSQKQTQLYVKVGLGLITMFGLIQNHDALGDIIKTLLSIFSLIH